MTLKEIIIKLFCFGTPTYYRWKSENRPVLQLIEQYFTKVELEEYLKTGKIKKYELIKHKTFDDVNKIINEDVQILDETLIDLVSCNIINLLEFKGLNQNHLKFFLKINNILKNEINVQNAKEITIETIENFDSKWWQIWKETEHPLQRKYTLSKLKKFSNIEIYVLVTKNTSLLY